MIDGGHVRLHKIQPGDALDRRRLDELFAWAAQRLNQIDKRSIANDQIGRNRFVGPSFVEMWYAKEGGLNYEVPGNPQLVPGTSVPVRNDDSYVFGELTYSVEAEAMTASCIRIVSWPVFASKALWSGECYLSNGDEKRYSGAAGVAPTDTVQGGAYNINDKVTLCGTTNFVALNGRMLSGVLIASVGNWRILGAQIMNKTRSR